MQVLTQLQENAQQEKKIKIIFVVLELWLIFLISDSVVKVFFSTKGYKVWSFSPKTKKKKQKFMDEINEKNSLYAISSS